MEGDGYYTNLMNETEENNAVPFASRSPPAVQQAPCVGNTGSMRPNQKRSKNFSEEEDKLLVAAWLNVSIDPAHFGREFLISFIQIRSSHQIVAKVHLSTIGQLFKSVSTSSVHRLSKLRVEGKAV